MHLPTAVMQVEGVLRKPVTGAVIESGWRLYHGLAGTYRLVLVTDDPDHQHSRDWLGMEGFSKHDHIVYWDGRSAPEPDTWLDTARTLKLAYGYDVDVIVLPDPKSAAALIRRGYSTLLLTQAAYALPEWRPDHDPGLRPWADLAREIETQRRLRAADKRMEEDI